MLFLLTASGLTSNLAAVTHRCTPRHCDIIAGCVYKVQHRKQAWNFHSLNVPFSTYVWINYWIKWNVDVTEMLCVWVKKTGNYRCNILNFKYDLKTVHDTNLSCKSDFKVELAAQILQLNHWRFLYTYYEFQLTVIECLLKKRVFLVKIRKIFLLLWLNWNDQHRVILGKFGILANAASENRY